MSRVMAPSRLPPPNSSHFLGNVVHQNAGDVAHADGPWRKFFDPPQLPATRGDPVTRIIAVEATNLRAKWLKFQSSCADEDRLDLDTFEPTIEGVFDLVNATSELLRTKKKNTAGGKITARFHKFCDKLESHRSLLKVLPEGNEYVSVFTGTLNAVIMASVNHERVAEELSEALCSISENVAECQAELEIFRTPAMLEKVGDLYAHIFIFLSSYMDWMMRKRATRLLDSFNENLARKFELSIKNIHERSSAIRNLVAQSSRAEIRATRLQVEKLTGDYRVGQEGSARHQAEMEYFAARIEQELIMARNERRALKEEGQQVKELTARLANMLQQRATTCVKDQRLRTIPTPRGRSTSPLELLMCDEAVSESQWTAEDISLNSAHLEDHFDRNRVRLPHDPFNHSVFPARVLQRLADWTAGVAPAILWIDGPALDADDLENAVTLLAATVIDMAAESHVPVVSYFCELSRGEQVREGESPQTQATLALLYGLLRQFIELLMPVIETEIDLSPRRFSHLDRSARSWSEALNIFTQLVPLMPDKTFCIIDGMHWLEDRSSEGLLADLIQALRESGFRILFTTSGRSPSLGQSTTDEEALPLEILDFMSDGVGVHPDTLYLA